MSRYYYEVSFRSLRRVVSATSSRGAALKATAFWHVKATDVVVRTLALVPAYYTK